MKMIDDLMIDDLIHIIILGLTGFAVDKQADDAFS